MVSATFFVHMLVVFPITRKILTFRPEKTTKNTRLFFAVLFLALVALLELVNAQYESWGKNHFEIVGVARDASEAEIRKAYKRLSLDLHPDKNLNDPSAAERFQVVSEAYNVLVNPETRTLYDRWGPRGLEWFATNQSIATNGGVAMLVTYISLAIYTYIMTMNSSHTNSRAWAYGGYGALMATEVGMRFGDADVWVPFFSRMALFQKINQFHILYPSFVLGVSAIQQTTYQDMQRFNLEAIRILNIQNKRILMKLNDFSGSGGSASSSGAAGVGGSTSKVKKVLNDGARQGVGNVDMDELAPPLPPSTKGPTAGWIQRLAPIAIMIAANYFMKS